MRWRSPERLAQVGISIQLLACIRTLSEYFRLKQVQGAAFSPAAAEPYVVGGIIAAVFCWAAVLLYFARRPRGSVAVAALTVVVLFAYKLYAIG
ncbi:MAG TPA: hypothetical protein VHG91_03545 [Longimicrobium sp.]|nr:hypothetical protein [Longimicrobium sp.]